MTTIVIPLHSHRGRTMPCIPEETLVLLADSREGADRAEHEEHLAACPPCRARLSDCERLLGALRETDPIEPEAFDPAYFEKLATEVEAGLDEARDLRPPRELRRLPRPWGNNRVTLPLAMAAALALALLWARGPDRTPSPTASSPTAESGPDDAALEAEARALGRTLMAAVLTDETETIDVAWAVSSIGNNGDLSGNLGAILHASLQDALDGLKDDELDSLSTQL